MSKTEKQKQAKEWLKKKREFEAQECKRPWYAKHGNLLHVWLVPFILGTQIITKAIGVEHWKFFLGIWFALHIASGILLTKYLKHHGMQ